jgi:hypothetical protein
MPPVRATMARRSDTHSPTAECDRTNGRPLPRYPPDPGTRPWRAYIRFRGHPSNDTQFQVPAVEPHISKLISDRSSIRIPELVSRIVLLECDTDSHSLASLVRREMRGRTVEWFFAALGIPVGVIATRLDVALLWVVNRIRFGKLHLKGNWAEYVPDSTGRQYSLGTIEYDIWHKRYNLNGTNIRTMELHSVIGRP